MFQMRCERDGFLLPARQADARANAESAETGCIAALGAIESKIKIAFRAGCMHLRVHAAIIGFLIDDEALRASLDNRHIILRLHWSDLDRNRRKIWRERAHAFSEIVTAHKFWMLAGD